MFLVCRVSAETTAIVTNCHDLGEIIRLQDKEARPIELTATVTVPAGTFLDAIALEDSTGGVILQAVDLLTDKPLQQGDLIRLTGRIDLNQVHSMSLSPPEVLAHAKPKEPPEATPGEILSGQYDFRSVLLKGVITDVFRDEIDPRFLIITVQSQGETLYGFLRDDGIENPQYETFPRAKVLLRCIVVPDIRRYAFRHLGRMIGIPSASHISILKTSDAPIPDIACLRMASPSEIAKADRHQAVGNVLATWHDGMMIQMADGERSTVSLATDKLPHVGETVRAIGFPETDLYHINLTRARWTKSAPMVLPAETVTNVTATELSHDEKGNICFKPWFHGRTIRLRGTVRKAGNSHPVGLVLEDGRFSVAVDASSCPSVILQTPVDSIAEITGICVLTCNTWRQNAAYPQINGVRVVVRKPEDIHVLVRPPWWNSKRLTIAIHALLVILFGTLGIIFTLRRLLEKRSRELEAEISARVESECLVQERTRLAVELHDSITQNLTGASLGLCAAQRMAGDAPRALQQHLDLARKTVDSSLDDLRNCIWDLRNRALEERDFANAIRLTLLPHVDAANLAIRFNVPREILSDNSAHTILCIIRELAINAIRHGNATQIKIVGTLENDMLLFSVRDNGIGFDSSDRPRMRQGHFGLKGIEERLKPFGGTFKLESRPGAGTKATVSITLPRGIVS